MESPGRYHNGQHTLHTPGASDPALCLLQTVIQTVEWTIKEACRLLYTAQFARVLLEDDFPPVPLEVLYFACQGKFKGYFAHHVIGSLPQFAADPMTTMNIQHYRLHKHCCHRSRGAHPNPYHQSLVFSSLSDAIHRCERRGVSNTGNAKKTESVVTLTPTSCKSKPIPKQRDFPTQRLLHFLSPVPAH